MMTDEQQLGEPEWTAGLELKSGEKVDRWTLKDELGGGANGKAWKVHDAETGKTACLKISIKESGNVDVRWEAELMQTLKQQGRYKNLVAYLGHGETVVDGKELAFLVVEFASQRPEDVLLKQGTQHKRKLLALKFSAQMLRGLYELHSAGAIHRDIKPENMGIISEKRGQRDVHIVKIFDFGMARLFVNGRGELRLPRVHAGVRGTLEYCSLRTEHGREQSRIDDLFSWLFTTVTWINHDFTKPLAWTDRGEVHRQWLKMRNSPAPYIFKNCPLEFYKIYAYLQMLWPSVCPNYKLLCHMIVNAHKQLEMGDQVPLSWPLHKVKKPAVTPGPAATAAADESNTDKDKAPAHK